MKETPSVKDVKAAEVASAKDKLTEVKEVEVPKPKEEEKKASESLVKATPPAKPEKK